MWFMEVRVFKRHATELDDEAVEYLRSITKLAPNHMPPVLACIDYLRTQLSDVSHVACFDTAFCRRSG